jgi:hypothetical protein
MGSMTAAIMSAIDSVKASCSLFECRSHDGAYSLLCTPWRALCLSTQSTLAVSPS